MIGRAKTREAADEALRAALTAASCGCGHDDGQHLNGWGACVVTLPSEPILELPAWRCPCRRFAASRLLAAVQSCTVHASDLGVFTRPALEAAYEATAWRPVARGA